METQILLSHFSPEDGYQIEESRFDYPTLQVPATLLEATLFTLRDSLNFAQLIDIVGIDYSHYNGHQGKRFAVTYHLLSLQDNCRLRLRAYCADDDFPVLPTATTVWRAASWFEREVFDLFGIIFTGHEDLRRILTDYGFVGYPFRKDFPLSGHVEMRYDPEQKRVIYQPVSIPVREVTPRIVREESYGKE